MTRTAESTFLIMRPIVERHVGDAAFYWAQHDQSIHSPLINLDELHRFDRLLDAHLDGIRVARDGGWQLAREALLRWKGPAEVFVCAYLALRDDVESRLAEVLGMVAHDPRRLLRGLIGATLWLPAEQTATFARRWMATDQDAMLQTSAWRVLACAPQALHGLDAPLALFQQASAHGCEHVRAAAYRAGAHLHAKQWLVKGLSDPVITVAVEAAISLQRGGYPEGCELLGNAVRLLTVQAESLRGYDRKKTLHRLARWVRYLALSMPVGDSAVEGLLELLPPRLGLWFVFHHGDPAYLSWVQEHMHNPECARLAGWVWSCLTGGDLHASALVLWQEEQDPAREYPTDILDPGLPMPNAYAIAQCNLDLPINKPLLFGLPVSELDVAHVLNNHTQAIRWAVMQRHTHTRYLNSRAHARLQRNWPAVQITNKK